MLTKKERGLPKSTVPERITALRHTLTLTQGAFADKICVSQSYITSLELGKRRLNQRISRLICSAFDVRPEWLQNGEGAMFTERPNAKIDEIVAIFSRLNPFFQDYFLDQMRRIYDYESSQDAKKEETGQ
jgi:transcriptional regulator with XRE-family HTH domain